jgi:signal transduction histidine kinase
MAELAHGRTRGTALMRYRNAAGEWRLIEWTLAIDPEDARMYGTARDVTERQATREALEKGRRLETVGRLAGGVAHDVNNALTAIGGFASLINDLSPEPEVRELATEIRRSVDRTAMMTRKLLAFSRRKALAPRIVDLAVVVRELGPVVSQLVTEAITVEVDLQAPPRVLVDPAGIEQIVMNLAVNARDAMPAGGRLVIHAGAAVLDAAAGIPLGLAAGEYAELRVSDTGTGMPESVRSRIFEPFFSTKGDAGTGLGLAIVHGLVTGAGGAIDVTSAPDQGTVVRILFPEAGPAAAELETPAETPAAGAPSRHVLVVEDEETIRRLAQIVLERAGHRVTVAQDGHEALAMLEAGLIVDLVITDIVMPGMSGIELARRVRERYPTLPIAFASGYDQGLMPLDGPFAGAPLLEKPYSPALLVAAVAGALG